jgi:hypothetical protein
MRLPAFRAVIAVASSFALSLGLVSTANPAHAATTITSDEVGEFEALWFQGRGPFTPALTAGPEVGWNLGLEDLRPPAANYFRLWDMKVAWRDVNTAPGVFDWSILDRRIEQVESWGAKPIMVLGLTPQWAAADPNAGDPRWGAGTASPPADVETWRAYVRALVQRYGGRIGAYEIWNEANLQTFWTGTPGQMANLVDIAVAEIGETAITLAPSITTRLASGPRFTEAMIAELAPGTLTALDAWSIHTYPAADAGPTVPQACEQRVDDIIRWQRALLGAGRTLLNQGQATYMSVYKPTWDTEVNFGLAGPDVEKRPRKAWSDADGAALLTCAYQDSRALGIAVTAWYEFTASEFDLLGVQMNPATPAINAAWAALPSTVSVTNPWVPDLSKVIRSEIVIEGKRAANRDNRFIQIEGIATGLLEGTKLVPYFRFPGQTGFTAGTARRTVGADGIFEWERKTGKRISVQFRTEDGKVRSNTVIIPAR